MSEDHLADLATLDATARAELVRTGSASPTELVSATIARIEALNPTLNAVIQPRFDAALSDAAGALPDGPFRGVPLLLKDLGAQLAGEPYHTAMPTMPTMPTMLRVSAVIPYTAQFNVSGQPAMSLPLHHNAAGLPIGTQLVAAQHREDVMLSLAADIERAAPWIDRRPARCA